MKHNLLYTNCPICGKQLINLRIEGDFENEYYYDDCNISILIVEDEEETSLL